MQGCGLTGSETGCESGSETTGTGSASGTVGTVADALARISHVMVCNREGLTPADSKTTCPIFVRLVLVVGCCASSPVSETTFWPTCVATRSAMTRLSLPVSVSIRFRGNSVCLENSGWRGISECCKTRSTSSRHIKCEVSLKKKEKNTAKWTTNNCF